jgi:phage terminase large subunit-like protein
MTNHPAAQSNPILEPHPPALLRLWTVAALPLNANVVTRLRSMLAHVAILGVPGFPEAAHGDAAMASRRSAPCMMTTTRAAIW